MPDDRDPIVPAADSQRSPDEAETLASLMDGTVTLDELPDEALGRLLSTIGPEELLHAVGTSPKLFPAEHGRAVKESRREVDRAARVARFRPAILLAAASVALAAAAGIALYLGPRQAPAEISNVGPAGPGRSPDAAEPSAPAALPAPVLLTARADVGDTRPPDFRGTVTDGREPRTDGSVIAVEDERVTIDLGALDGIDRGSRVDAFRNQARAGTVTIERVFRERASGTASAGAVQAGDVVRVPLPTQVAALLSAAADRLAAGDRTTAHTLTQRAVERSGTTTAMATPRVQALARLGALDREAGNIDSAEKSLRAALREIDGGATIPAEDAAEIGNELGALLIGRGQIDEAMRILRPAHERATGVTAARVANNLAAALALAGDRPAAERHYREALDRVTGTPASDRERRAIQQNLDGLNSKR